MDPERFAVELASASTLNLNVERPWITALSDDVPRTLLPATHAGLQRELAAIGYRDLETFCTLGS